MVWVAAVQFQSLVQELPHALGETKKKKNQSKQQHEQLYFSELEK